MANLIKLTPEVVEEAVAAFKAALGTMRLTEGKITFNKNLAASTRKATLLFSEIAWLKMTALVNEYQSEIGWHGTARRGEGDMYLVDDIIVYPQNVTGATVTPDQVEYQNWLMEQPDEVFQNIRFQGHSHVNMGVTPSGVDTAFYDEILAQLDDTMFYIFMVINKRGERTIRIYDMAKNLYFGNADVSVEIRNDSIGVESLLADASSKVKQVSYQTPAQTAAKTQKSTPVLPPVESSPSGKQSGKKKPKAFGCGTEYEDWDDYYEQLRLQYGYGK